MKPDNIKKAIAKEITYQAPKNFSSGVMNQIFALNQIKKKEYKPLIPKEVLWLIPIFYAVMVFSILVFASETNGIRSTPSPYFQVICNFFKGFGLANGEQFTDDQIWVYIAVPPLLALVLLTDKIAEFLQPIKK